MWSVVMLGPKIFGLWWLLGLTYLVCGTNVSKMWYVVMLEPKIFGLWYSGTPVITSPCF